MEDRFIWLEDIDAPEALAWVAARNAKSARLTHAPGFEPLRQRLLSILTSKEQIPRVTGRGAHVYNFWRDEEHPRGLWRRTTFSSYRSAAPDWDVLLDIDALCREEQHSWVFAGARVLYPTFDRALVLLSAGGGDAVEVREFDLVQKAFVTDGFHLPAAKSNVGWIDRDHVYVGTDFGPGSLTDSGYPRLVKRWQRGTPLTAAVEVFAGAATDVASGVEHERDWVGSRCVERDIATRSVTFYSSEVFLLQAGQAAQQLPIPADAVFFTFADHALVLLRSEWNVGGVRWPQGALLAAPLDDVLSQRADWQSLFNPGPRHVLAGMTALHSTLILHEQDHLQNRAVWWRLTDGQWTHGELSLPPGEVLSFEAFDRDQSDAYFVTAAGPVQPTTLYYAAAPGAALEVLKTEPAFFDAAGLAVEHGEARSKDGTLIPYVLVGRAAQAGRPGPTLLYGYGGFEVALLPSGYQPVTGAGWIEEGGRYVIAGIRGGGEFGPAWHQDAILEHKQRSYDDFIAVAEHLCRTGVTTPSQLGIMGGSNGGLLVGAVMAQRPDLFGAVVSDVPLADMRRFHRLLAGASWMGEYGDPDDPEQWAVIERYSPYQNLKSGVRYPRILITTSTRDDRVHPGHARKMTARLEELGADVLLYENTEGGHAGAADPLQTAHLDALTYVFLREALGLAG